MWSVTVLFISFHTTQANGWTFMSLRYLLCGIGLIYLVISCTEGYIFTYYLYSFPPD